MPVMDMDMDIRIRLWDRGMRVGRNLVRVEGGGMVGIMLALRPRLLHPRDVHPVRHQVIHSLHDRIGQ